MSDYVMESFVDWEYITSPIVLAAMSRKCQSNVTWKTTAINFINNRLFNCMKLSYELRDGDYCKRAPKKFLLNERGKVREISPVAFRDRIVEKSLCENCLIPLILPKLLPSNCASLAGRGLSLSKELFIEHLIEAYKKYGDSCYCVKIDYKDYFHSINNSLCFEQLSELIYKEALRCGFLCCDCGMKCLRTGNLSCSLGSCDWMNNCSIFKLLKLISVFIFDDIGLGLGNQTSQTAAIYYPYKIDDYCFGFCDGLYGRYMDDSYGFVGSKAKAKELLNAVRAISRNLKLELSPKKCFYTPVKSEICWLKDCYKVCDEKIVMNDANKNINCCKVDVRPCKSVIRFGNKHLKGTKRAIPRDEWLWSKVCWEKEIRRRYKTVIF